MQQYIIQNEYEVLNHTTPQLLPQLRLSSESGINDVVGCCWMLLDIPSSTPSMPSSALFTGIIGYSSSGVIGRHQVLPELVTQWTSDEDTPASWQVRVRSNHGNFPAGKRPMTPRRSWR